MLISILNLIHDFHNLVRHREYFACCYFLFLMKSFDVSRRVEGIVWHMAWFLWYLKTRDTDQVLVRKTCIQFNPDFKSHFFRPGCIWFARTFFVSLFSGNGPHTWFPLYPHSSSRKMMSIERKSRHYAFSFDCSYEQIFFSLKSSQANSSFV